MIAAATKDDDEFYFGPGKQAGTGERNFEIWGDSRKVSRCFISREDKIRRERERLCVCVSVSKVNKEFLIDSIKVGRKYD